MPPKCSWVEVKITWKWKYSNKAQVPQNDILIHAVTFHDMMNFFGNLNQIQAVISRLTTRWCCLHPLLQKALLILCISFWKMQPVPPQIIIRQQKSPELFEMRVIHCRFLYDIAGMPWLRRQSLRVLQSQKP